MTRNQPHFLECESFPDLKRRHFLQKTALGAAAMAVSGWPSDTRSAVGETAPQTLPETIVKLLYDSMTEQQRAEVCFGWDYIDPRRGLLRTRVSNNWNVTDPEINSGFYTDDQRAMIREIFEGIVHPDWHARIDKQLDDDAGGFGESQSIAIFGEPGESKFEFVMTGRHMTLRCDGNSADHVAFGGPIFYGHAAEDFHEESHHPGNVFWEQGLAANSVYQMLDGRQRQLAEVARSPDEGRVGFRGQQEKPGIPVSELSPDQRDHVQGVLHKLIEPYRQSDRDEVVACLDAQGGLDQCHLMFYTDNDIGDDRVWDNWRLEGPAFVWHFRGSPHVHVWVNVADDPSVKLNAHG